MHGDSEHSTNRQWVSLFSVAFDQSINLAIVNFFLTLWLHSSGGGASAQLQSKPLVAVQWLTGCTAELWLAAETSWSVSTSPHQSGDCDMLQNQCYQSVLTISRAIKCGVEIYQCNKLFFFLSFRKNPNFTSGSWFEVYCRYNLLQGNLGITWDFSCYKQFVFAFNCWPHKQWIFVSIIGQMWYS